MAPFYLQHRPGNELNVNKAARTKFKNDIIRYWILLELLAVQHSKSNNIIFNHDAGYRTITHVHIFCLTGTFFCSFSRLCQFPNVNSRGTVEARVFSTAEMPFTRQRQSTEGILFLTGESMLPSCCCDGTQTQQWQHSLPCP